VIPGSGAPGRDADPGASTPDRERNATASGTPVPAADAGRAARGAGGAAGSTPESQGIVGRVGRLIGRILGWGPVPILTRVLDTYGNAGGGLLAGGLAFGAMFALIPATLLVVGVAGFVVADPTIRNQVLDQLVALVPPLEPFVTVALDQLAAGAVAISIVGLVGFLWTASQFYGQIDHSFALILDSPRRRDMIERTIRGLVVVGLVIALFILLIGVSIVATESTVPLVGAIEQIMRVVSPFVGYLAVVAVVMMMYRVVPTQHVPYRAAWLPAVAVGAAEALLTGLFVFVAPFLASPKIFGPFFTIFATFAWLSWTFQILLYGTAWVAVRIADAGVTSNRAPGDGSPTARAG
jgi:membrane protein